MAGARATRTACATDTRQEFIESRYLSEALKDEIFDKTLPDGVYEE